MIKHSLVICLCFSILACSPESTRIESLRKEITQAKQDIKRLEAKQKQAVSKLYDVWLRSLKYRFSDVKQINPNQEVSLQMSEIEYLKAIRFKYLNKHNTLEVVCNYKTDHKKVQPVFFIYLFDDRGINIHKQEIKYKNLFKLNRLTPGKLTSDKHKIKWSGAMTPTHFLIRKAT